MLNETNLDLHHRILDQAESMRPLPQAVLDLGCRDIAPPQWREWGEDGRSWFSVDTPQALAEGLLRYGAPG